MRKNFRNHFVLHFFALAVNDASWLCSFSREKSRFIVFPTEFLVSMFFFLVCSMGNSSCFSKRVKFCFLLCLVNCSVVFFFTLFPFACQVYFSPVVHQPIDMKTIFLIHFHDSIELKLNLNWKQQHLYCFSFLTGEFERNGEKSNRENRWKHLPD